MIRKFIQLGLFLLGAVLVLLFFRVGSKLPEGGMAPPFSLKDETGRRVSLSDFSGNVVLINFWATWCPPCLEEMPSLAELYQKFQGKSFVLLTINQDSEEAEEAVLHFKTNNNLDFPVLFDDGTVAAQYDVSTLPQTFLLDRNGKVIKKILGGVDWMSEEYILVIEKALGEVK